MHVGNQPGAVAVGPDGVWVSNTWMGRSLASIPVRAWRPTRSRSGLGPSAIAFAGDAVWVANEFDGTMSRVNIGASGEPETISTISAPRGAAAVGEELWISVRGAATSHRGGTLRVAAGSLQRFGPGGGAESSDSIDPAVSTSWWILINTNDGLVGFKRVGGQAGQTLVPDLAVSLPTPADDGRTYRFQLREDLRYSTGDPVRASDFLQALERGFRIEDSYFQSYSTFAAIVGAAECTEAPATCDLSEGIEIDDAAGTITFHLTEPDPAFLYKLALPPAFAVPAGTPSTDMGSTPVPATGPYMVDRYAEGEQLVLVRNPEFHAWYAPAQPNGYPDRIEVTLGLSTIEQTTAVESGSADWMTDSFALSGETIETLVTQYAGRVHPYPEQVTFFLALNTSMPPFDDIDARRAVNYALDRSEFVDLGGGPQRVRATCQFLPPNLPGYEQYCPYTSDPNPAGQWSAPDMDRARALIEASGTTGDTVVFWPPEQFTESQGITSSACSRSLGIESRFVEDDDEFTAAVSRSPDRVQASVRRNSDYPSASDFFLGAPRCGSRYNPFSAAFCDRELDAAIERAERAQSTDPQLAGELWTAADQMLVDLSPWVFLVNPVGLDFVSARVGNYQYSAQWGILLDQLWVQ